MKKRIYLAKANHKNQNHASGEKQNGTALFYTLNGRYRLRMSGDFRGGIKERLCGMEKRI